MDHLNVIYTVFERSLSQLFNLLYLFFEWLGNWTSDKHLLFLTGSQVTPGYYCYSWYGWTVTRRKINRDQSS